MANIKILPYADQDASLQRQAKLAQLLQEQAATPQEQQMVSGYVIPNSPLIGLSKMLEAYMGKKKERDVTEKQAALKQQAQAEANNWLERISNAQDPSVAYRETPIMENASDEDRTEMQPKMVQQDTDEQRGDMVPAMQKTPFVKQGMSDKEMNLELMRAMSSGNPMMQNAAQMYASLRPKAVQSKFGTSPQTDPSTGKQYVVDEYTGNVHWLNDQSGQPLVAPIVPKEPSKPSSIQEYEYAVKQGFKGSLADYEKMKAINVNVPAAETYGAMTAAIDPVTKQPIYVRGGSRGSIQRVEGFTPPPKAPTEQQSVDGIYADKIQDAEDVLGRYGAGSPYKPPSVKEQVKADIPLIGNQLVDEPTQTHKVAERAFIEAWLRRSSGAVISAIEFEQARKQYIPQPGDTDKVLEQKRKARQRVLQGMQRSAGQYYDDAAIDNAAIPAGFNVVGGSQ